MIRTFIQTREFSRNWDELGFDDEDLRMLEKDKDNLSKEERNNVKKVIEALRKTLGGGFDE